MSEYRTDHDDWHLRFEEDGYLTIVDYEEGKLEVRLGPNEAVNLASALLQYATQARNGKAD
jgi:hypothetical protein